MKIGYICADVDIQLLGHEGCSIHIREFNNALIEAGHEVFIMCSWVGESATAYTKARVYPICFSGLDAEAWRLVESEHLIRNAHLDRDLKSVFSNLWLKSEGSLILEKERPDFLCERYSLFGWGGVELSRRFNLPLILEVNTPLRGEQEGYEKFTLMRTAERMETEIIGAADAVITVSRGLRDWAVSLGAESANVHTIPNGVADRLFSSELSGQSVKQRYGLNCHRVIGFVGSFHPWHDIHGLLKAFHILYQKDYNLRLLLVGDGEQRPSLEKAAAQLGLADAVVFSRSVPHEDVPQYIAAMDVAVVPYRKIRDFYFSPLKLFEYMAVGRPTIAAALGQISEIVEHEKTGWLYPAGDEEKLVEGLATLLYTPELASRIGKTARRKILDEYTWKGVATKVVDIAQDLSERRGRPNYSPITA
jgi:glycosyltransferase involved in cell wall biosynthesis